MPELKYDVKSCVVSGETDLSISAPAECKSEPLIEEFLRTVLPKMYREDLELHCEMPLMLYVRNGDVRPAYRTLFSIENEINADHPRGTVLLIAGPIAFLIHKGCWMFTHPHKHQHGLFEHKYIPERHKYIPERHKNLIVYNFHELDLPPDALISPAEFNAINRNTPLREMLEDYEILVKV